MDRTKFLGINQKISIVFASWPLQYRSSSWLKQNLYGVYYRCVRIYFVLFVATQWIQTYCISFSDFQQLMDNISVALDYSIGVAQLFACMSDRAINLIRKVEEIEDEVLEEENEEVIEIHRCCIRKNVYLNKSFATLGLFTVSLFFFMPVMELHTNFSSEHALENNRTKPLPFSSWFPFDKYKHYCLAYSLQVIAGIYSCQIVVCTDLLFYSLMIFCIGQIKILQVLLKNFEPQASESATLQLLKKYVEKHKTIIEFVKELNDLMKYLMLMSFSVFSLLLAAISSQIISIGFGFRQLMAVQFLLAMLIMMMLFYWHANEIRLESLRVANAIWESKWYECSTKVRRNLLIMMMRSQKALTLSVGPFYVMSTDTMIIIIKATYSYITLMRQSYLRKQEGV